MFFKKEKKRGEDILSFFKKENLEGKKFGEIRKLIPKKVWVIARKEFEILKEGERKKIGKRFDNCVISKVFVSHLWLDFEFK